MVWGVRGRARAAERGGLLTSEDKTETPSPVRALSLPKEPGEISAC